MFKLNCTLVVGLFVAGSCATATNTQEAATPAPVRPSTSVLPYPTNVFGTRGVRKFPTVVSSPVPGQVVTQAAPIPNLPQPTPPSVLFSNGFELPAATAGTNGIGPKITFQTPVYDFGRVKSGDPVKYTYIFTNIGDQVLELANVQPQCGCTAAGEWTRKVPPGESGQIPIQFNTANYGQQVIKTITVACNDRTQPVVVLQLKGTLWKPIELIPPYTILNILPDAPNASGITRIVNNMEQPLELTDPVCSHPSFKVTLKTNTPGKEYQMSLSAVPPLSPGTLQGKVTLKSSATNAPTLEVPFWANVQAPLMVLPAQIMIPANLPTKVTPSVTIQNNTTNSIVLTEASVNLEGAEAQIRELQPGRIFSVQVTIPQGLEIPQGQKGLLTLKTSHPAYKVLEVPIVQMPKPVTPMQQTSLQRPFSPKTVSRAQGPMSLQPAPITAGAATNKPSLP